MQNNAKNSLFPLLDRENTIAKLKELYDKGFRYVVRDKGMQVLTCFSLKPKRDRELEMWVYVNAYVKGAIPAYVINNNDITEINYNNKSATTISDFINRNT